jgi:hypothetical protein
MTDAVSLRPEPLLTASFADAIAFVRRFTHEAWRLAIVGAGVLLVIGGFGLALLPFHLGLPLLVVGLIMVLRHSPRARRQFVTLQHRHPRFIFPVRRLIRREPEVFPVAWQQLLRIERMMLPHGWRRAGHWRRRYFRSRR